MYTNLFFFINIMLYWILSLLLLLISVNGFVPLRKHHYHIQTPMNETEVLPTSSSIKHLYKSEGGCGEASLSCMAFGYKSSIPIRCGILQNVPLCERIDPVSKNMKCDVFCDTDGGGRLCERAFPSCCLGSVNGCTSSKPKNIKLYSKQ